MNMYAHAKKDMKKTFLLLTTMMMVVLTSCQETLEERCEREAKTFTEKNCPLRVAPGIAMDSMTFDKATHTIAYIYTLSGVVDDTAVINQSQPRERLLQEVKNSTNMKLYKEAGFSFRYTYFSTKEKGTKLFEATFRKSDYNQ